MLSYRDPTRRQFLTSTTAAAAGLGLSALPALSAGLLRKARRGAHKLQITHIETHNLYIPWHSFNDRDLFRYHGHRLRGRTILVLHTNVGLVGLGDSWGIFEVTDEHKKRYLGASPLDFLGSRSDLFFNMAIYDLVGKYLDVPAWKLLGQQVRQRIPVAAWTCSLRPEMMAKEIQQAASLGYRWLKYHVDQVQNGADQARAMQAVAPAGFRVHLDFNMNSPLEHIDPVLQELKSYPVIGRIEDPIGADRPQDWQYLCQKYDWPILSHHAPSDFMVKGYADGHMAGHAPIGEAIQVAAMARHVGKPIMLQQCGGYINQAFLAHEASVFDMATIDHVNLAELWTDQVVKQAMPITDGTIGVPDGPGLGVTLDWEKLRQLKQILRPDYEPFLVRIKYQDGPVILARHDASQPGQTDSMRFIGRLLGDNAPGPPPRYNNRVHTDWMEPDEAGFSKWWDATRQRKWVVVD